MPCPTAGDGRTAADARLFLLGFLKRFPQYAASDFYLSGESYGKHVHVVRVCGAMGVGHMLFVRKGGVWS